MRKTFKSLTRLSTENWQKLDTINDILEEYMEQNYTLTLRQLYYQLVSRDLIPNEQKEYQKLSTLLVKGRMGGLVDWAAIEDRIRVPYLPWWSENISDALQTVGTQYRLDRQKGQNVYVEVWCEKDALSAIIKRVTRHFHMNLMINRGYSSCSAMHDAACRFDANPGKAHHILYVGDHDPSGLDMLRDVHERLEEFGIWVAVHHVALTHAQVQEHNPPPNPTKLDDPRADWYISQFGHASWEVDALPPQTLEALVREAVVGLVNNETFEEVVSTEESDREEIFSLASRYVEDDN
jgi:hypothetical protein